MVISWKYMIKCCTSKMTVMKADNIASVEIRVRPGNSYLIGDRNVKKKCQNLQNNLQNPFLLFKISHSYIFQYKIKLNNWKRMRDIHKKIKKYSEKWKIKQREFVLLCPRTLVWDNVYLFSASVRCSGATAIGLI